MVRATVGIRARALWLVEEAESCEALAEVGIRARALWLG
jgi:hypothetical protein